jgi:hypothetical protein
MPCNIFRVCSMHDWRSVACILHVRYFRRGGVYLPSIVCILSSVCILSLDWLSTDPAIPEEEEVSLGSLLNCAIHPSSIFLYHVSSNVPFSFLQKFSIDGRWKSTGYKLMEPRPRRSLTSACSSSSHAFSIGHCPCVPLVPGRPSVTLLRFRATR